MSPHPCSELPDCRDRRSSVAGVAPALADPVVRPAFTISPRARIATTGSCFVTEPATRWCRRIWRPPELTATSARAAATSTPHASCCC